MTDAIIAGSIWVQGGTHLPKPLLLQSQSGSHGWRAIANARPAVEKTMEETGWTFFFMAGEIKVTVFGFDRQKALQVALQRLIANVGSQHCNSIEITRITGKSLFGVPYLSVSAHPRHFQKGALFSDRR
jgi:hypothetical protein